MTLAGRAADHRPAVRALPAERGNYDFFFIHFKDTDMYGEDGNFAAKRKAIEGS